MFLKSLTLSNILSFGPEPHTVELGPLNVIIGPNGSGKSNFIEAIGLLKAAPTDIQIPFRTGGGVAQWLWKGEGEGEPTVAAVEAVAVIPADTDEFLYRLEFSQSEQRLHLLGEEFSLVAADQDRRKIPYFEIVNGRISRDGDDDFRTDKRIDIDVDQSMMSQLIPPFNDLDIHEFAKILKSIQIIGEIDTGREAPSRRPQRTDLPNLHLSSNGENLGLILNRIKRNGSARRRLNDALKKLYEPIEDLDIQVEGGTVQAFIYEQRAAISSTRLSSGTLRFLCLLAVLCHPDPPPLICLEEPELGLHPDIIPVVSDLLKEASERTQIIVTTHSEILIDTLTDRPDAVIVAERGEAGTRLTKLDADRLKPLLARQHLGQIWTSGEIGGTRW